MEPPDALEKCIRFICGFLFGLVLGVTLSFQLRGTYIVASALVAGVVGGLLATRYGDEFWYSIKSWWWF